MAMGAGEAPPEALKPDALKWEQSVIRIKDLLSPKVAPPAAPRLHPVSSESMLPNGWISYLTMRR